MPTQQYADNRSDISSPDDRDDWHCETVSLLALSLMSGVGYWTLRKLALSGLTFQQVTQARSETEFSDYLKQGGCKTAEKSAGEWFKEREQLVEKANQLHSKLKDRGIEVIHSKEDKFPQSLRDIKEPPMWLFVQGDVSILHQPAITIVGTRNPTMDGKFLAQYVGRCLSYFKEGVTVSGLASGIDQIIHQNSLRFNIKTIAFIGTGILLDYPAGSEELRQEIYKNGGAIVSEYLPNQSYSASNFVQRNRLQAGLARVVIPVEWKEKSGTAHTVRFAKECNRKIICLKQPGWNDSHTELSVAKEIGAEIFTIPGQESDFIESVKKSIELKAEKLSVEQPEVLTTKTSSHPEPDYSQLELFSRE